MVDFEALAKLFIGFIIMIALCVIISIGVGVAELVTYDVEAEYMAEAVVTKVDADKNEHGGYSYRVFAVDENGEVYSDYISEEQYAVINVGDTAVFEVTEASTCFGERRMCNYQA